MKYAKVDANHLQIVIALRTMGASVQSLAAVGKGCPDLLVGFQKRNYLMEVKDGRKVESRKQLTKDQITWHGEWNGKVNIVYSVDDAINILKDKT